MTFLLDFAAFLIAVTVAIVATLAVAVIYTAVSVKRIRRQVGHGR